MRKKDSRRLKVGVLGCGPIAQFAHFESCVKARNADLYAICDVAEDLVQRMSATHEPTRTFLDYDAMLADPELDAMIIATSDAFHVEAPRRALEAGKHVLCEKPIGVSIEEVEALGRFVERSGKLLQVGHMKRFDIGLEQARDSSRRNGRNARVQGLVLRFDAPVHGDRRRPADAHRQQERAQAKRESQSRFASILHARPRQPSVRYGALSLR